MKKVKLETNEVNECGNCLEQVDYCDECGRRIDLGETVYCNGMRHICIDCRVERDEES